MIVISGLLPAEEAAIIRELLVSAPWEQGSDTAHGAAKLVKKNEQLTKPSPELDKIRAILLRRLHAEPRVEEYAMPVRIVPPFVNRHVEGCSYGKHVDRAGRLLMPARNRARCDLSATIALNDKSEYEGGALTIYDGAARHTVRLSLGDMVIYPAGHIHEVTEVTKGERLAACLWMQSAIKDPAQRAVLASIHDAANRVALGDCGQETQTLLAHVKQNLHRLWMET